MIVIDVGAYDGAAVTIPFSESGDHIIYAIEPIPDLARELEERSLKGVSVFNLAIDLKEEMAPFFINRDRQMSSLLPTVMSDAWSDYTEELCQESVISILSKRLDTFIEENQIEEVDFLRIHAQGNDFNVVKSAGSSIHRIKRIALDVQLAPLYEGSAEKGSVVEYLESHGFRLSKCSSQTNGLEENLEFIRVNRFVPDKLSSSHTTEVYVPFVGDLTFPENDYVAKLLEEGIFEGPEQAFLWLYLRPGDTFLDCGAHVGLFSAIASRVMGQDGVIWGFEPDPEVFDLYRTNLERLGHKSRELFNIGLSIQDGIGELVLGGDSKSAFSTFATSTDERDDIGSVSKISVEQKSLDSILEDSSISTVNLAKLDVEGWEHFVLQGAKKSIDANKFPVWMIEFTEENAKANSRTTSELRQLIESFGYTLCYFNATTLLLESEPQRSSYTYKNLFAVKSVEQANHRLRMAEPTHQENAKQLIRMWDTAFNVYSLRKEREHLVGEISLAQQELSVTRADLLGQVQALHHQAQSLDTQLREKEALTTELYHQLSSNEYLMKDIHSQLLDKDAWNSNVQVQLVEKEALIHELDSHLKKQKRELRKSRHNQVILNKKIVRLTQRLDKFKQSVKDLRNRTQDKSSQLKEIRLMLKEMNSREKNLREEVIYLKTGRVALKNFLRSLISRLKRHIPGS